MIDRYVENLRVMEETAPSYRDLQFVKVSPVLSLSEGYTILIFDKGQPRR